MITAATEAGTAVTVAVVCVCWEFGFVGPLTAVVGGTLEVGGTAVLPLTVADGFDVTTAAPATNCWLNAGP